MVHHKGQTRGLIVHAVSDIVTVASDAMQPPPATSSNTLVPFLEGLTAVEDRMVMVLDLNAVSAGEELAQAA